LQPKITKLQALLRDALAAAPGAPNPNKPIGARVRVRNKGVWWKWPTWSKGYLVDISDGNYYCVLDDGGAGWYDPKKDAALL
jgi:hypothetical protein